MGICQKEIISDTMGLIEEDEIVRILREKNAMVPDQLESASTLIKSLWVLDVTKRNTQIHKITAKAMSSILLRFSEINLSEEKIKKALARSGNKIKIHPEGNKTYYEIMNSGKKVVEEYLQTEIGDTITFFSGSTPWSDLNKNFPQIINRLEGDICIVDSYYGLGSLYTLAKFGKERNVKFLSASLGKDEQQNIAKFEAELKKFKSEFKNITIRKYDAWYELHDRYIFSDNALFIVGHGIKDLGTKESFGVFLPKAMVGNLLTVIKDNFEKRWAKSKDV